jgi:hypothetical protein
MASDLLRTGGIELAKEVSAPFASLFALGGFTAWWLITSNDAANDESELGHEVTSHLLSGLTIIDKIQAQYSNFVSGTVKPENEAIFDDSNMNTSTDEKTLDRSDCLDQSTSNGSSKNSLDGDSSDPETPILCNFSEQKRTRLGMEVTCDGSNEQSGCIQYFSEYDVLLSFRGKLISAIMQGNEGFVSAALDSHFTESIDDIGCDEYGNTFLILAVQVN